MRRARELAGRAAGVGGTRFAVCAALTVLALLQSPGTIVADSKIDLVINPVQWLERSLHLWSPAGAFGQVQNQAYGYLWPMGPFFALGTGIGLPAWLVQRLWWALLLCVAYLGVVLLAERLRIGTPTSRLVAGLAFALSPRILTELGALSVEAWPTALAPWVLIPLVGLAGTTSPAGVRRAVAASALAVACAGGVNATAVFAVVPLGFLWLLRLRPRQRRVWVLAAWCAAVVAATAWWIIPLLVLGRYSPPFLDYIETAAATTGVTDPVTVLRGASHWVAWLADEYQAELPAGWALATDPVLVGATVVLAAIGLVGLARPGMPHRRFLVTGLVLGTALVGLGHVGELPGTFAAGQRAFLDGIGAPLRNVHKFDVLLRLPLALGIAHLLGVLLRVRAAAPAPARDHSTGPDARRRVLSDDLVRRMPALARPRRPGVIALLGTVAAVVAVASPALAGGLAAPHGFAGVPGYWREAAGWLNDRAGDGRVLVLPGARFPHYTWGDTLDEITQPLLTGPAAVRSVIPLSPAMTIRMMDAVESTLATGYGSAGLADYLARAGVAYVLVRNDLHYGRSGTTAPPLVHQALSGSPGFAPAATFGPAIPPSTRDSVADRSLGVPVPALQVLRVDRPVAPAVAYPADQVATVVGGPESLLWLAEAGLLPAGPTVLAGDLADRTASGSGTVGTGPVLVTDGLRLRDLSFGRGRDAASATLTASGAADAHDYRPPWGPQWMTTVAYSGVAEVRAASSRAQADSIGGARPEHQPYAAVDGDPTTSWRPAAGLRSDGQWLEVVLEHRQPVPQVIVHFDESAGGLPSRITVATGAERTSLDISGRTVVVPLRGANSVRTVRLTIDRFATIDPEATFAVTELEIPGVTATRTLVVPAPPGPAAPAAMVLTAAPSTPACFFGPTLGSTTDTAAARCFAGVARTSEDGTTIDRTLRLAAPSTFVPAVWARPRPGEALDALLDGLAGPSAPAVLASSSAFVEPAARPGAVLDGDAGTTWWAGREDTTPELRFTWPTPQPVTGLRLTLSDGVPGTPVSAVTVTAGEQTFTGLLTNAEVHFDTPLWTDELTVGLLAGSTARSYDPYANAIVDLPVAVSEVRLLGATPVEPAAPPATLDLPCGSGPGLVVGDRTVATRVSATVTDLLRRREIPAVLCGPSNGGPALALGAGTVRVVAAASDLAVPTRVSLEAPTPPGPAAEPVAVPIDQWSATQRRVTVAPHEGDLLLAVRENTNPGWVASIGEVVLEPVVVDGWQQAWVVPAGLSGTAVLRFAPDTPYRTGLLTGAGLLLLVVGLAAVPPRRRPAARVVPATPDPASTGSVTALVVGAVALVVTGGLLGAAIAAAVGSVAALRAAEAYDRGVPAGGRGSAARSPFERKAGPWLPAALLLLGGGAWLAVPSPTRALLPQLAGLLAVAALWLPVVLLRRYRRGDRGLSAAARSSASGR